jgi:hypothetical protein
VLIRRAWLQPRLLRSVNVLWLNARLIRRWIYREVPLAHNLRQIVGEEARTVYEAKRVLRVSSIRGRLCAPASEQAWVGRALSLLVVKRYARATGLNVRVFLRSQPAGGLCDECGSAGEPERRIMRQTGYKSIEDGAAVRAPVERVHG